MSLSEKLLYRLAIPIVLILLVPVFLVGARMDFLGSMTDSWIRMLGLIPFAIGLGVTASGIRDGFRSRPEAGHPAGIYCHMRHPVGLGVIITVAAQYLLYDWPPIIAYVVVLFVTMDCLLRFGVEPRRLDRHGQAYADYLESVPRWIPRRISGRFASG